jgi:hypothetical protein
MLVYHVVAVDSVPALTPKAEIAGDVEDSHAGPPDTADVTVGLGEEPGLPEPVYELGRDSEDKTLWVEAPISGAQATPGNRRRPVAFSAMARSVPYRFFVT